MKKNENYSKMMMELEKANTELAKVKDKNEALKGSAKEKEKVSEDPLIAQVAELQSNVDAAAKELAKGYDAYEKAIAFGDEDVNLINEKARILYAHKHYSEAASNWKRLISKGKNSEENYLQIGKAYYQGKDFDNAEGIFNEMAEKFPNYIPGFQWAANNASAKDPDSKLGLAKDKFIALISKASKDSVKYSEEIFNALRYLGYNALQADKHDEAKTYYTRMLNLDPGNKDFQVKAYGSLNTLYISMGDYGKAMDCNNKILALDPNNGAAKSNTQYIMALQQSSAKPKANPNEITGVIKDESGSPIASASVRVKDTAAEAWTNAKGEYRFTMPEASSTLVVSAKGYETKEITVTKSRVYNTTLSK
jgi:tetratricopeptide (TPR) repeat protein